MVSFAKTGLGPDVKQRAVSRTRRSLPAMMPAPVGGLNGRDTYAAMPATDAFVLDNFFPYNTSVDTRGGTLDFATGMTGPIESLAAYTGGAGSKLLAFGGGNIYDATAGGAIGAAIIGGKVSSRMTSCMFSNAGTQFLLLFSGSDAPMSYDGAALANLVITGAGTQNTLHSPHPFKGRVFIAQAALLGFYYLAVGAIQGAASYFDLSQISLKGGYLQSITSFSADSGNGPDDYAIFATSEGEYIVYKGTDPSTAATWALVGRYVSPPPIGKKGWFRFRGDVYFITEEGIISFAQIRQQGEGADTTMFISDKLGRNYTDVTQYKTAYGWCGIVFPKSNMLLVNVPYTGTLAGEFVQFAMNTNTNAWGRFKSIAALDWVIFNGLAYYSTYDGKIIQYGTGYTDNGVQIKSIARQAWQTFANEKIGLEDKQFHMAQLVLKATEAPTLSCVVNVNFEDDPPLAVGSAAATPSAVWDVALWDVSLWGASVQVQNVEIDIGKIGYVASLWIEFGSLSSSVQWIATRMLLEPTHRAMI